MSFDIPQMHIPDNSLEAQVVEAIIKRDRVTPEEAVRSALRGLATHPHSSPPKPNRKAILENLAPLSEAELLQLDGLGKTFGLLADVSDEDIDRMAATILDMKSQGFPNRA